MILPFVITIRDNHISETGAARLKESSFKVGNPMAISKFDAVTPDSVERVMSAEKVHWNYPWEGQISDFETGLIKSAYQTTNPAARMACFMSHYLLWKRCVKQKTPILVFEHDAVFSNKFDLTADTIKFDILGINNPLGATRKAQLYYDLVTKMNAPQGRVPLIDEHNIPQGLAGNSAYVIKPAGAEVMIKLTRTYGAWPNDALMCRQLVKSLGVTKKFYTYVNRMASTTT